MTLIGLVPEVLIEIGVTNLLNGLNVVDWVDGAVVVIHVNLNLLERPLRQEETLDAFQCGTRAVIGLLNQRKFFTLALVEATLDRVGFAKSLSCSKPRIVARRTKPTRFSRNPNYATQDARPSAPD